MIGHYIIHSFGDVNYIYTGASFYIDERNHKFENKSWYMYFVNKFPSVFYITFTDE